MTEDELKKRTKQFALRILKLISALPNTTAGRTISNQLARSGTSVPANYRAACRGRSKAEFISKLGVVEEEAQIETPYHRPTIQLLKFTEGKAKGSYELRFCTYDHRGRFQRMPLIVDARDLAPLRKALKRTPKLRKLLAQLLA